MFDPKSSLEEVMDRRAFLRLLGMGTAGIAAAPGLLAAAPAAPAAAAAAAAIALQPGIWTIAMQSALDQIKALFINDSVRGFTHPDTRVFFPAVTREAVEARWLAYKSGFKNIILKTAADPVSIQKFGNLVNSPPADPASLTPEQWKIEHQRLAINAESARQEAERQRVPSREEQQRKRADWERRRQADRDAEEQSERKAVEKKAQQRQKVRRRQQPVRMYTSRQPGTRRDDEDTFDRVKPGEDRPRFGEAKNIVNSLLEDEQPVSVCAHCEAEHGIKASDGPLKSHGICNRHLAGQYRELGFSEEKIQQIIAQSSGPPDLGPVLSK